MNCKIWIIGFLNEAQNPRQARHLMIRHTETPFRCHLLHIAPLPPWNVVSSAFREGVQSKIKKEKEKMLFMKHVAPHIVVLYPLLLRSLQTSTGHPKTEIGKRVKRAITQKETKYSNSGKSILYDKHIQASLPMLK